jgi:hypothetical protein
MKIKHLLVFIAILLVITGTVYAGGTKVGTAAAAELMIPMGARSVGIGGSNIANVQGAEAIYWNPAGLSLVDGGQAKFDYVSYFADMSISYLAAGIKAGNIGTFGVSLQVLSIGEIPVTTINKPEGTGEILEPNYLTANLSFSRQMTDRINFGVNTKLISESVGDMTARAFAIDFGLQYRSDMGLDFGFVMRNLGTKLQYTGTAIEFDSEIPFANPNATSRKTKLDMAAHELPTALDIGLAYRYAINEQHGLNITGIYSNNNYSLDLVTGGLEYSFSDFVFIRGGYNAPLYPGDYPADEEFAYGLTFGAGVEVDIGGTAMLFDYAFRDMEWFGGQNFFSLGFAW